MQIIVPNLPVQMPKIYRKKCENLLLASFSTSYFSFKWFQRTQFIRLSTLFRLYFSSTIIIIEGHLVIVAFYWLYHSWNACFISFCFDGKGLILNALFIKKSHNKRTKIQHIFLFLKKTSNKTATKLISQKSLRVIYCRMIRIFSYFQAFQHWTENCNEPDSNNIIISLSMRSWPI